MSLLNRSAWKTMSVAVAIAGLAAGCSSTPSHSSGDGASAVIFPDPAHSTMPEGEFVNVENLRKVAPGMSKEQLQDLLGAPHFDEGVFGVKRWNYLFDFRKADGSGQFFQCQYQIVFDKNKLADQFYWKPETCKAVLENHVAPPAPVAPQPASLGETIRLSSDALFDFDKADLTVKGHQQLDQLLETVRSASQVQNILIVGYTDRLGSDSYNLALSQRRAASVREYLVDNGVPAAAIQIEGRGKANPVVDCPNTARAKLIVCLAPNRRVELSGVARVQP
ncbi:OmpA family protein [Dyella sp. 20L07]|uniref:outer membrane protein assembly factor BamE n=1 Tax=Dyella sp. 20L07 TaxID=3384240 RepID=UPI003D2E169F